MDVYEALVAGLVEELEPLLPRIYRISSELFASMYLITIKTGDPRNLDCLISLGPVGFELQIWSLYSAGYRTLAIFPYVDPECIKNLLRTVLHELVGDGRESR